METSKTYWCFETHKKYVYDSVIEYRINFIEVSNSKEYFVLPLLGMEPDVTYNSLWYFALKAIKYRDIFNFQNDKQGKIYK